MVEDGEGGHDIAFPENRGMGLAHTGVGMGRGWNINIPWPHDRVGAGAYDEAFRTMVESKNGSALADEACAAVEAYSAKKGKPWHRAGPKKKDSKKKGDGPGDTASVYFVITGNSLIPHMPDNSLPPRTRRKVGGGAIFGGGGVFRF